MGQGSDRHPFVLVVCGPSGCGKSTVIERLVPMLGSANFLRFDDYEATNIIT